MKRFVVVVIAVLVTGLAYGQLGDQDEYEETSLIGYELWRDEAVAGETKQFKAVVLFGSRSGTTLFFHDLYNTNNSLSFVVNRRYPDMTSGQLVTIYFTAHKSGLRILKSIDFGLYSSPEPEEVAASPTPDNPAAANPPPQTYPAPPEESAPVDPPAVSQSTPPAAADTVPPANPAPARSTNPPVPTYPPMPIPATVDTSAPRMPGSTIR
ncbi:hypothetical protein FACS189483_03140 [Spirochaetia bacterium]|nr:hypothetical protein FACS189483_03140 [Spirochaetia bacterium]